MTQQNKVNKESTISLRTAYTSLGLTSQEFNEILDEKQIDRFKNSSGKPSIRLSDYSVIKENFIGIEKITEQRREAFSDALESLKTEIQSKLNTDIKLRQNPPKKSIMYVGPTNSGKTYHGLNQLFDDYDLHPDKVHVYCGPLRLLAFEVYNKMMERYGSENVGFITGEEQINPDAKLLATTAEMAPREGHSILVDEAHWLTDSHRGHVWTRLLMSSEYENIYSLTAAEGVDLIKELTSDAWFSDIKYYERKTPMVYRGDINIASIPPKTAVVCFSRKTVYATASYLLKKGKKVGVLYGGLPLAARKKQIEAYLSGKYDVMVVTDVIGHGINLPIDNVVFTQTTKFDGDAMRPLHIWEGAQIAGRAGRFGLSEEGSVYIAKGLDWFSADKDDVRQFVLAAGGKIGTDLFLSEASVSPNFEDLGLEKDITAASQLLFTLTQWEMAFGQRKFPTPVVPNLGKTVINNWYTVAEKLQIPFYPWTDDNKFIATEKFPLIPEFNLKELWQLIVGPYTSNSPTLPVVAEWLVTHKRDSSNIMQVFFEKNIKPAILYKNSKFNDNIMEQLEKTIQIIGEVKMAFVMFGKPVGNTTKLGSLDYNDILDAEEEITEIIIRMLISTVKETKLGECSECGDSTPPWFGICNKCHYGRTRSKSKNKK